MTLVNGAKHVVPAPKLCFHQSCDVCTAVTLPWCRPVATSAWVPDGAPSQAAERAAQILLHMSARGSNCVRVGEEIRQASACSPPFVCCPGGPGPYTLLTEAAADGQACQKTGAVRRSHGLDYGPSLRMA